MIASHGYNSTSADMLNVAFSRIGNEILSWVRLRHMELYTQLPILPRSGLEEALFAGMVGVNTFAPFFEFDGVLSLIPRRAHALVRMQQKFGIYTVDFLVEAKMAGRTVGLIDVECDSVQFHDPKKDAKRDIFMREHGLEVLRFGGKEIMENPTMPCLKIIEVCEQMFRGVVEGESVEESVGEPVDEIPAVSSTGDPPELHDINAANFERASRELYPPSETSLPEQ